MKIKVCGLKYFSNISEIIQLNVDYIGFIFYNRSPRYLNDSLGFDEARNINPKIKKVGVFVDEPNYSVLNAIAHYDLDFIQLHGNESPNYCKELKPYVKIIKAFGVNEDFDFQKLKQYENVVNYFLFDTATSSHGGSGKMFDWKMLNKYHLEIPFFIGGGISEEHAEAIQQLNFKKLFGVDLNSKFEISPGLKEVTKIKQFLNKLK